MAFKVRTHSSKVYPTLPDWTRECCAVDMGSGARMQEQETQGSLPKPLSIRKTSYPGWFSTLRGMCVSGECG